VTRSTSSGTSRGVDGPDEDLRVFRLGDVLAPGLQLLEELLTWPHAHEDDVDVVERLQAKEPNHVVNIINWS